MAAPWSDGTSRELKTYSFACEAHFDAVLADARQRRQSLAPVEGEEVGEVGLYRYSPGQRDRELSRVD